MSLDTDDRTALDGGERPVGAPSQLVPAYATTCASTLNSTMDLQILAQGDRLDAGALCGEHERGKVLWALPNANGAGRGQG